MLAPHFVINPVNFSVWQRLNPAEPGIGIVNDILAFSASGWPVMATESIALYLLLGAVGVPVFSSGGGIGALFGPTGGFLIAMLFEALAGSLIADHENTSGIWRDLAALLVGEIVVYAIGVPFLKVRLSLTWTKAFAAGMTPFLVGDSIKIIAALPLGRALRGRVKAFLDKGSE